MREEGMIDRVRQADETVLAARAGFGCVAGDLLPFMERLSGGN